MNDDMTGVAQVTHLIQRRVIINESKLQLSSILSHKRPDYQPKMAAKVIESRREILVYGDDLQVNMVLYSNLEFVLFYKY